MKIMKNLKNLKINIYKLENKIQHKIQTCSLINNFNFLINNLHHLHINKFNNNNLRIIKIQLSLHYSIRSNIILQDYHNRLLQCHNNHYHLQIRIHHLLLLYKQLHNHHHHKHNLRLHLHCLLLLYFHSNQGMNIKNRLQKNNGRK